MATKRSAHTVWQGDLKSGSGEVSLDSSEIGTYPVTWASRAEEPEGRTSPEELIAAAHCSCFSMALSNGLGSAGTPPAKLVTRAEVTFVPGTGITGIHLTVEGEVPGIEEPAFLSAAQDAKANCPVSQALSGTEISLTAKLA